jgi:D-alanyl-D-alanine carboxypeptidase
MKRITLLVILLVIKAIISMAQVAPKAVQDSLNVILKETQTNIDAPAEGGVMTVTKIGAWQFNTGSGFSDKAKNVKATGKERFRVGSITKTFVATSILKLASQNKLKLDDKIGTFLTPNQTALIPNASKITVRQLLHHTSGIADIVNDTSSLLLYDWFVSDFKKGYSFDSLLIKYLVPLEPTHAPDNKTFSYCNTGYLILGEIIKKTSGLTWQDYIKQNIIMPLQLTNTTCPADNDATIDSPFMHGYTQVGPNDFLDLTNMNVSVAGSAGAIISTTDDLNTFFIGLLKGSIIPKNWVDTMTTFNIKEKNPAVTDGFGIFKIEAGPYLFYGHTGGLPGYSSLMFYMPKFNTYVSTNFNSDFADNNSFMLRLIDYLATLPPTVATKDVNDFGNISVYPNPTSDYIRIKNKTGQAQISILDIHGREVYRNENYEDNSLIEVADFEAGIYFVVTEKNGSYSSKKFVKM